MMKLGATIAVGLAAIAWTPAFAQAQPQGDETPKSDNAKSAAMRDTAGVGDTADIIVTAQKRSESVQKVPIAISAFSGDTLARANVTNVASLTRLAPSLRFDSGLQASKARLVLRGIGSSGGTAVEPSVATFVDGVYVPREGATLNAYMDLEAVEVLRGPQGTLFGRNASVGAINLRTTRPKDEFGGELLAEYGTGDRYKFQGILNTPISDSAAFRLVGMAETFGGLYHNLLDGKQVGGYDTYAIRLSGRFELAPNVTLNLQANYGSRKGDGFGYQSVLPGTFPGGKFDVYVARFNEIGGTFVDPRPFDRTINQFTDDRLNDRQGGLSSELAIELSEKFSVKVITGYQHWKNNSTVTGPIAAYVPTFYQDNEWESESFSNEVQLVSSPDALLDGRMSFVAGLYYFRETYKFLEDYSVPTAGCQLLYSRMAPSVLAACQNAGPRAHFFDTNFSQTATSLAAYGQATFRVTDQLQLVGGARWTEDKKDGSIRQVQNNVAASLFAAAETTPMTLKDDRPTWRVGLNWEPNQRILLYSSYSTGFKSGGFNSATSGAVLGQRRLLKAETSDSFEIGAKTSWLNRALTLNIAAYRMTVKNFQDRSFNGIGFSVQNAGDIRSQGIELDTTIRPIEGLQFNFGGSYLDAKFTDYSNASPLPGLTGVQNITGKRPTFAPKFSGTVGGQYRADINENLGWLVRADMAFVSDANIGQVNDANPQTTQNAYQLVSARGTIFFGKDQNMSVSAFVDNLFDAEYCNAKTYYAFGGILGIVSPGVSPLKCTVNGRPRTGGVSASLKF